MTGKKNAPPGTLPGQAVPDTWEKNTPWILGTILLLALALRLLGLWSLSGTIYFDFLLWDERIYHEWASRIADGTFQSKSVYEFPPLYAYMAAALYRVLGPDPVFLRFLNVGFGVLACGFVYLIGRSLAGRKPGLLAALIAALYGPFVFYSAVPLKEMFGVCLFAGAAWLLLSLEGSPAPGNVENTRRFVRFQPLIRAAALGVTLGLLINVRPNAAILLPAVLLILPWLSGFRGPAMKTAGLYVLLVLIGTAIALSPFVIRNWRTAGEFTLTTSQGGFNFNLTNNLRNPDPYTWPVPFATTSPFEQGIQYTIEASRRVGKRLSPGEASRYWTKVTLQEALEQPGACLKRLGEKTLTVLNRYEAGDHYDIGFMSDFAKFFKIPFPAFWFVMPLGMAGMVLMRRNGRKAGALIALAAVYGSTLIAFSMVDRYRLPLLVILIPFAAVALERMYRLFREGRRREMVVPLAVAALFGVVAFLPVPGSNDRTAYYNTHAVVLVTQGYHAEALRYWKASADRNGRFSDFARIPLAANFYTRGMVSEGDRYLEQVRDSSFFATGKYELLGDYYLQQRQLPLAAAAYERALRINSGLRMPRIKLIRVYQAIAPEKVRAEGEKLKDINMFYDLM